MFRKIFSLIFFWSALGLSPSAYAICFDLLASYEPSEINDLTVVVRQDRDPTLDADWPVLGGVNDVPEATEGDYVLRLQWTDDNTVEVGYYWSNFTFDLAGFDYIAVDVYFTNESAIPGILGIWDDIFGWLSAVRIPNTINEWHTVVFYVDNLWHTNLNHIFALKFENMAGDNGTIYIDNLQLVKEGVDSNYTSPYLGRKIKFSGYWWSILRSEWPIGVGPNFFTDDPNDVWVDQYGYLHQSIVYKDPNWYCGEVIANENLGYGTYVFTIKAKEESLDPNIVLGMFIYDVPDVNGKPREIDFELSRWWDANEFNNAQYVLQPWDDPNHRHRFHMNEYKTTTHEITWIPNKLSCQSYYGNYPLEDPLDSIECWHYSGDDMPEPGCENPRINFWLLPPKDSPSGTPGAPPSNGMPTEVIIKSFLYIPICPDLDNDGIVNFFDFAFFAQRWLECTSPKCGCY